MASPPPIPSDSTLLTQPSTSISSSPMPLLESLNLAHLPPSYTIHAALFVSVRNASFLQQQLLQGNPDFEYAFIDARVVVSRLHLLAAVWRAVNDMLEDRLRSRNVHSEVVCALSPSINIAEAFRRFGISAATTELLVVKIAVPRRGPPAGAAATAASAAPTAASASAAAAATTTGSGAASAATAESVQRHLARAVEGSQVAFCDAQIARLTDEGRVRKLYRLDDAGGLAGGAERGGKGAKKTTKSERLAVNGGGAGAGAGGGPAAWRGLDSIADGEERRREMEVWVLGAVALRGAG